MQWPVVCHLVEFEPRAHFLVVSGVVVAAEYFYDGHGRRWHHSDPIIHDTQHFVLCTK